MHVLGYRDLCAEIGLGCGLPHLLYLEGSRFMIYGWVANGIFMAMCMQSPYRRNPLDLDLDFWST